MYVCVCSCMCLCIFMHLCVFMYVCVCLLSCGGPHWCACAVQPALTVPTLLMWPPGPSLLPSCGCEMTLPVHKSATGGAGHSASSRLSLLHAAFIAGAPDGSRELLFFLQLNSELRQQHQLYWLLYLKVPRLQLWGLRDQTRGSASSQPGHSAIFTYTRPV